ncbi:MAG: sulfatase-like hydrolase/transferase [Steroidobacteraceae bacterium]
MFRPRGWRAAVLILLVLGLLLSAGYALIGGRVGLALLAVKFTLREYSAPHRVVNWQRGPDQSPANVAGRAPNIILIVVDDLGFNDLTLNGGFADGRVPTPNIDRLAQRGVHFATAYSGSPTCAPSRAALLTGRNPTRFGFEFTPTGKQFMRVVTQTRLPHASLHGPLYFAEREAGFPHVDDMGLPTDEVTIADVLTRAGYHTVHIGKWHLGDAPRFRAHRRGFNESLSLRYGASMFLPEDDPRVVNAPSSIDTTDKFLWAAGVWGVRYNDGEYFQPDRYLTDYFTDEAIKVIEANRHRPYFLFLAYNAPHTPLQALREDYDALSALGDHRQRVYGAMIRAVDRSVGRLLAALEANGTLENTLVIFTSDNGGPHTIDMPRINAPYRGWKASYFEGGVRVPMFLHWPAALAPRRFDHPVTHFDLFSTIVAAAGASAPAERALDGVDLLPFARGERSERPHQTLYWRTDRYLALRDGDWKLQVTQLPQAEWLFDLSVDPQERRNLASREPTRLAELKTKLAAYDAAQAQPLWPSLGAGYIPIDKTMGVPQEVGDEYVYFSN